MGDSLEGRMENDLTLKNIKRNKKLDEKLTYEWNFVYP